VIIIRDHKGIKLPMRRFRFYTEELNADREHENKESVKQSHLKALSFLSYCFAIRDADNLMRNILKYLRFGGKLTNHFKTWLDSARSKGEFSAFCWNNNL
jgi:hypothetical protein